MFLRPNCWRTYLKEWFIIFLKTGLKDTQWQGLVNLKVHSKVAPRQPQQLLTRAESLGSHCTIFCTLTDSTRYHLLLGTVCLVTARQCQAGCFPLSPVVLRS